MECDLAMRMPAVHDRQGRRILILYRFSPELAGSCLRPGYEARQFKGYALGGIALVRRHGVRSPLIPARIISSENALHFVDAVQTVRQRAEARAMIMRHDTSSRLHAWIGGRGRWQCPHYHARFRVVESPESIDICGDSDDRQMHVAVQARLTRGMRRESMFRSTDQVLRLLQNELRGLGLIHRDRGGSAEPRLALRCEVIPLRVDRLESSFFGDSTWFPRGTVEFDSAYWLRDVELVWSDARAACCDVATA